MIRKGTMVTVKDGNTKEKRVGVVVERFERAGTYGIPFTNYKVRFSKRGKLVVVNPTWDTITVKRPKKRKTKASRR